MLANFEVSHDHVFALLPTCLHAENCHSGLAEPPVSSLYTNNPQLEVTDEAGSLIAGTYETGQETLDPSKQLI